MIDIKFRGRKKYCLPNENPVITSRSLIQEYQGGGVWERGLLERGRHQWTGVSSMRVDLLVGTDSNGNEVYDGDKLVNRDGKEFTARVMFCLHDGKNFFPLTDDNRKNFTLKEIET